MAFGYETRVATTQQLLVLINTATELGLDRQVNKDLVVGHVDEAGWHVISILVPNCKREGAVEGETLPVFHRTQVLMKQRDSREPAVFVLDVTDDQFEMLGTYEDARAAMARAADEKEKS